MSKSVKRDDEPGNREKETSEIRTLPSTAPPPPLTESGLTDAHLRVLEAFLKGEPEPPEVGVFGEAESLDPKTQGSAETRPTARPPALSTELSASASRAAPVRPSQVAPPLAPQRTSSVPVPPDSESALLGRAILKETSEIRVRTPAVMVEEVVPSTRRDFRRE